jgi:hypothetical protein
MDLIQNALTWEFVIEILANVAAEVVSEDHHVSFYYVLQGYQYTIKQSSAQVAASASHFVKQHSARITFISMNHQHMPNGTQICSKGVLVSLDGKEKHVNEGHAPRVTIQTHLAHSKYNSWSVHALLVPVVLT